MLNEQICELEIEQRSVALCQPIRSIWRCMERLKKWFDSSRLYVNLTTTVAILLLDDTQRSITLIQIPMFHKRAKISTYDTTLFAKTWNPVKSRASVVQLETCLQKLWPSQLQLCSLRHSNQSSVLWSVAIRIEVLTISTLILILLSIRFSQTVMTLSMLDVAIANALSYCLQCATCT